MDTQYEHDIDIAARTWIALAADDAEEDDDPLDVSYGDRDIIVERMRQIAQAPDYRVYEAALYRLAERIDPDANA